MRISARVQFTFNCHPTNIMKYYMHASLVEQKQQQLGTTRSHFGSACCWCSFFDCGVSKIRTAQKFIFGTEKRKKLSWFCCRPRALQLIFYRAKQNVAFFPCRQAVVASCCVNFLLQCVWNLKLFVVGIAASLKSSFWCLPAWLIWLRNSSQKPLLYTLCQLCLAS